MTHEAQPPERRRYSRVPFSGEAYLTGKAGSWPVHLVDISVKGVLVEPPPECTAPAEQHFDLELRLDEEETVIRAKVSAIHITGCRVGFAFTQIDTDSLAHLRRLLELNLGDANRIDRDVAKLG